MKWLQQLHAFVTWCASLSLVVRIMQDKRKEGRKERTNQMQPDLLSLLCMCGILTNTNFNAAHHVVIYHWLGELSHRSVNFNLTLGTTHYRVVLLPVGHNIHLSMHIVPSLTCQGSQQKNGISSELGSTSRC